MSNQGGRIIHRRLWSGDRCFVSPGLVYRTSINEERNRSLVVKQKILEGCVKKLKRVPSWAVYAQGQFEAEH